MKKIMAISLMTIVSMAHADTTWQEANAMDQFCKGEVGLVLTVREQRLRGETTDPSFLSQLVNRKAGAIAEKMLFDLDSNPNIDIDAFSRSSYAMCMDNARKVLLGVKGGYRTHISELR